MTWLRRHPQAIAYILIVAVAGTGLWNAQRQQDELCEQVEGLRATLSALVGTAIDDEDAGGGGLPLTRLPAYPDLDPATQQAFREIEMYLMQDNPRGAAERLRRFRAEHLAPAECG